MYCNACGSPLQSNQSVCGRCGNRVLGPVTAGRVQSHAKLLGVLWVVYSIYVAVGGVALYVLAHTIFSLHRGHPGFLHPMFIALAILLFSKAAAGVVAGIGLYNRESWARLLAIVIGAFSLLNIPIGTALGIYTLWVLFSPAAEAEYQRFSASA